MNPEKFKSRSKELAREIIALVDKLPRTIASATLAKQLVRSGTSIGANYRAACRARSNAEMLSKLGIVEEEADETMFWLELLMESGFVEEEAGMPLWNEADEILSMTVASIRTLRTRPRK